MNTNFQNTAFVFDPYHTIRMTNTNKTPDHEKLCENLSKQLKEIIYQLSVWEETKISVITKNL